MKLELPVDLIVSRLQLVVMKKYKKELDKFGRAMNAQYKDDLDQVDAFMKLPLDMMDEGIRLGLLSAMNGDKKYVFLDLDV